MEAERKRPEEILARIKEEELTTKRGKLKIFLGMAAGVGKTYSMLGAARALYAAGIDVVAGLVVTHGRKETDALLQDLPTIPEREVEYKGSKVKEFDIDAALARKPTVLLVDELAHTNVPGSRHEKRWQDVEELLQAGISVYTTLNIQHIESLNDVVAQITGVRVSETVPDAIFEQAYEIELIDLPPDDLIQRLKEGKVYIPERASKALENFFKKGNLIALRELSLRVSAERVDAQMLKFREQTAVQEVWPVADRILVCVGPGPLSIRLVRAAKRLATRLDAEWMAVYVETPATANLAPKNRARITRTLEIAARLGANTDRISGQTASEELIRYAQRKNVSKIVIGKPARPRWREIVFGSVVDDLVRKSGHIDVYVISGDKVIDETVETEYVRPKINYPSYCYATLIVGCTTLLTYFSHVRIVPSNIVMIYMLAVAVIALHFGLGPSILASVLSVACFDFFFIPPIFSLTMLETEHIITFAVMFVVTMILSTLASKVKVQAEVARKREADTAALYAMTREQATAMGAENVVHISVKHIKEVFDCKIAVFLAEGNGTISLVPPSDPSFAIDSKEFGVAQWVFLNSKPAGASTSTLAGAKALYMPLVGSVGPIGVIGFLRNSYERLRNPDELHLLETFVNQMALAVERAQLGERRRKQRANRSTAID